VRRLAHALKGAAGNLGAVEVSVGTQALEEVLRRGGARAEIAQCGARLGSALTTVFAGIREVLAEAEPGLAPPGEDTGRLGALLARLDFLLKAGDMTVNELARTEQHQLRAGLGKTGENILKCIDRYDYEAASELVRATRSPSQGPAPPSDGSEETERNG
jgi:HPt (histidine-containing phosphotransfer) domain-containing protein